MGATGGWGSCPDWFAHARDCVTRAELVVGAADHDATGCEIELHVDPTEMRCGGAHLGSRVGGAAGLLCAECGSRRPRAGVACAGLV